MNIKITIPRNTATKGGRFFNEICEACNRGSILVWNEDYTKASLIVDTKAFLDVNNVRDILEEGGEVENYPFEIKMSVEDYNTLVADERIIKSFNTYVEEPEIDTSDIPEEELKGRSLLDTTLNNKFAVNNLFKLTRKDENGNLIVTSSYNMEYIPASAVFEIFKNFEIA